MSRPRKLLDPLRQARIAALHAAVQSGAYVVDAEQVAGAILRKADALDDRWFCLERAEAARAIARESNVEVAAHGMA